MKRQSMAALRLETKLPDDYDPLDSQRELQRKIAERFTHHRNLVADQKANSVYDLTELVTSNVQAIQQELAEMVDYLPWKWWKSYDEKLFEGPIEGLDELEELIYEAIDVQHFLNNIYIALGLSWDDVMRYYHSKQLENRNRQERGY